MEALDQQAAFAISALRCLMKLWKQTPVGEHLPSGNPQPGCLRGFKKRRRGGSKVRAKHRRGGGSVRSQRMHELTGHATGVGMIRHAGLFGQRAVFQPVEQRVTQAAEHAQLREMSMRVDEAGQKKAAAQVHRWNLRDAHREASDNRRSRPRGPSMTSKPPSS